MQHIASDLKCDPAYGQGIAELLGIKLEVPAEKEVAQCRARRYESVRVRLGREWARPQ